ncbi:hypothetical protein GS429_16780 [Natronorubrum sp. JWXQ-INN-674]|uniref:Uncharacterized protein n=1 Tax=Natronorubrum halalkaliphilum TaxID=2691917 RepID=A0A6B0VQD7_9EURY|nr:hypothetical protein [Natronorubrum halalkaliphilum]MXV63684.1 hypothetical protein [Natronorubrum halalkaliphilum]
MSRRNFIHLIVLTAVSLLSGCIFRNSTGVDLHVLNRRFDDVTINIEITDGSNTIVFEERYEMEGADDDVHAVEITEQNSFEGYDGDSFDIHVQENSTKKRFDYRITCADRDFEDRIYIEIVEEDIEMSNSVCR